MPVLIFLSAGSGSFSFLTIHLILRCFECGARMNTVGGFIKGCFISKSIIKLSASGFWPVVGLIDGWACVDYQ